MYFVIDRSKTDILLFWNLKILNLVYILKYISTIIYIAFEICESINL